MFKKLFFIALIAFSCPIKSINITIYFEDRYDAKDFEKLFDKEEELVIVSTSRKETENGGYCMNILNSTNEQFRIIKKVFFKFKKEAFLVYSKNGQFFGLINSNNSKK